MRGFGCRSFSFCFLDFFAFGPPGSCASCSRRLIVWLGDLNIEPTAKEMDPLGGRVPRVYDLCLAYIRFLLCCYERILSGFTESIIGTMRMRRPIALYRRTPRTKVLLQTFFQHDGSCVYERFHFYSPDRGEAISPLIHSGI